MNDTKPNRRTLRVLPWTMMFFGLVVLIGLRAPSSYSAQPSPTPTPTPSPSPTPPPVALSDTPLVLVTPAHPQVLFLLTNSQSMDGNLSGAIMTGASGNYTVPAGFTPPAKPDSTLYTVNGVDNSASRMNVAKASLKQILTTYASSNDFGLMTSGTVGDPSLYNTWVYYMSAAGGFAFTDDSTNKSAYPNPCYPPATGIDSSDCTALAGRYGDVVSSKPYFIAAGPSDGTSKTPGSSDDPQVNDVLYAGSLSSAFVSYGGPTPPSPYWSASNPSGFTLDQYNAGAVCEGYNQTTPFLGRYGCPGTSTNWGTSPTNAGYVPFAPEVLYVKRGFGYYNAVNTSKSTLLVPVAPDTSTRQGTFNSLLAPETNNPSSGEIKSNAVNAATAVMLQGAYDYYTNSMSSSSGGAAYSYTGTESAPSPPPNNQSNNCDTKKYVVLVTDGLPTLDLKGKAWPPLGSLASAPSPDGYGVTAPIDPSTGAVITTSPGGTNNQAVIDAVAQIAALKNKNILTYVIGMGAGVEPKLNPAAAATLKAMAIAGGTGDYFAAKSPADVTNDMVVILEKIQKANASTTSAAVNSTSFQDTSRLYQSTFNSDDWSGDLLAFDIGSGSLNTNTAKPAWSAGDFLDAASFSWDTNRRIITINPTITSSTHPSGTGVPFRWSATAPATAISATQQTLLMTPSTDTTLGQNRLNYLRGDKSLEQPVGSFRKRTHLLGDIANSSPVYVGSPGGPYQDSSYKAFKAISRPAMLYVGANDGMLHAFRSDGKELYAYVPNAVFGKLSKLVQPTYTAAHQFYVDGSPTAGDVYFGGAWHTILVGGLNNGGSGIYALDITTPPADSDSEATVAANVLWEFTDSKLGQTYSRPTTARIDTGSGGSVNLQSVVIFGSGYNNSDGKPYLYIVNAQDGTLIRRIDLCGSAMTGCDTNKPNGLSGPAAVSTDGTGLVTTIYAGDLQGNLWKVDLTASTWTGTRIFQTPAGQAITTTPVTSLHPDAPLKAGNMVYIGTGQYLGSPDITTTTTQSVYGIWDKAGSSMPVRDTTLVKQTISEVTVTSPLFSGTFKARNLTMNTIDWSKQLGWYFDLTPGERVVTDPRLVSKRLTFTTFIPSSDPCVGAGSSWLMVVNYATGGAFPNPTIDIYGKKTFEQYGDQNQAGVLLGNVFAAAPTYIGGRRTPPPPPGPSPTPTPPVGTCNDAVLLSKSDRTVDSPCLGGGTLGRTSWIQLK